MEWVSARAGPSVKREFPVRATLWGRPGVGRDVVVLMVPPRMKNGAPESAADDFSASRRAID
jgi:NADH:ubiquinone oxidoreductase subunit F (NADH-binding)